MRRRASSSLVAFGMFAAILAGCAGSIPSELGGPDGMAPLITPPAHASSVTAPGAAAPAASTTGTASAASPDRSLSGPASAPAPGTVLPSSNVEPSSGNIAPTPHRPLWPVVDASNPGSGLVLHVPILMYHRIVDPLTGHCGRSELCVKFVLFDAQLQAIATAGWHAITVATLAMDLARGIRPPTKTFVITIDDGHLDGLTNALPILERYHFVATYFVVTGRLWEPGYLHPADLETLAEAGMEIGDHSVSHRNLQHFDLAGVLTQVDAAAETIRSIVGQSPTSFAYPFGDTNQTVLAGVADSGVAVALMNRNIGIEDWANRFALPRLEVKGQTGAATALRTVTNYASLGSWRGA